MEPRETNTKPRPMFFKDKIINTKLDANKNVRTNLYYSKKPKTLAETVLAFSFVQNT